MYLKYNKRLWTINDVMEANRRRMNESTAAKKRNSVQRERMENMKAEVNGWDHAYEG